MNFTLDFFKKKFLSPLLTVLLFILGANAFSQSPMAIPDAPKINIPTSPEAAMIQRFGDIPIGYYTGTTNISVPMYTLSEGGVSIPITLSYHSSGIKVDDQATWVGLGWELAPEGQIVQEVRGKNDDADFDVECNVQYYTLFMQRFQYIEDYMFINQLGRVNAPGLCGNGIPHAAPYNYPYEDPYCKIDQLLRGARQPDIFNYNFGQYSGKFYVNPETHAIVMLDKKEGVLFERIGTTAIKATLPEGTIYNFSVIEQASAGSQTEYTGKTYKLSNITFLNGKTIDFTYTDEHYTESRKTEWADAMGTATVGIQFSNAVYDHAKKRLTRITSADTYIDFSTSSRDDINTPASTDNATKLSSIEITSRLSGKKVKRYEFTYSYFGSFTVENKRLKLDKVQEIGFTDAGIAVTNIPPTQFSYDMSVTMPDKNSTSVDFWGYYNAAYNTTKVPDLSYFDYLYKDDYSTINIAKKYAYTGSSRFTNNATAGAYLLNRIAYPTGGYTDFGYEPNSFTNQFIPDLSQPFYKNTSAVDNSINGTLSKTISFKLSRGTTIHFNNSINNGTGNYNGVTPLTYAQMQGCYIKFSKFTFVGGAPTFTLIKQWDLSTVLNADFTAHGGNTWSEDLRVEYDPTTLTDPYFNYQVTVEYPDNLNNVNFASIAGVVSNFTYYDETGVDITESHQGGMRIKTIKNYTQSGTLASDKLIKYYDGKLLNKFHPMSVYKVNTEDVAGYTGGIPYEYIGFYKKMTVPDHDFGTAGGNLIGYGKVEEIELVGGVSTSGKKVYNYFNQENKNYQDCPALVNSLNGELSSEQSYDASNALVAEKINSYQFLSPLPTKYLCINIVKLALGSKVPCAEETGPSPFTVQTYDNLGAPYPSTLYGYNAFTLQCEYHKLTSTTNKLYSNGNIMTTTENYGYSSDGLLASKNSTNSKGEYTATSYSFVNAGLAAGDPGYNYMLSKHMIGIPVIIEDYLGSENPTGQKVVYGTFSGLTGYWPKYTYQHIKTNPWDLTSTIDTYDDKANVTQYTGRNGIPISVVWNSDKTLPVAKVENATYASLLALPGGLTADFRTTLPNARVTSFIYKPLIGVSTITDVNNHTQTYEYDEFNRLNLVRDQDNNILKKLCYNYVGQIIQCAGSAPSVPVCSPATNSVVNSTNVTNIPGYQVVCTNYSNPSLVYTFSIPSGTQTFGCLPKAKYYVTMSKISGTSPAMIYSCNGSTISGTTATFLINLAFGTTDANISIVYDNY